MMDDLTLARAVHILALVHWIGGVAAVTTIVLPHVRTLSDPKDAITVFEEFERRFAHQARWSILLVGLSGLYMLYRLDGWDRFRDASFWWLHRSALPKFFSYQQAAGRLPHLCAIRSRHHLLSWTIFSTLCSSSFPIFSAHLS